MISAYPLQWPAGWPRTKPYARKEASFSKQEREYAREPGGKDIIHRRDLTIMDGCERALKELGFMGIDRQDIVISTNVRTRLDGLPRSGEPKPGDPGVAVYWETRKHEHRVMAIDRYTEVADNLAAVALTLAAMRAIERHGGAQILDRAFTGFEALPAPGDDWKWRDEFAGLAPGEIDRRYRELAAQHHPDKGGDDATMAAINRARDDALREARA
ncbi:MAG TPA: J domain-containing protein [Casimicrobiaceae bacterium]|nr:J domain-containing protein [Casimicrobiaceae bacterium]